MNLPMPGAPRSDELRVAIASFKHAFFAVIVFSMFLNLLALTPSVYMMQVYDRVLVSRNVTTLEMLTVITVGLFILMSALEALRTFVMVRIGMRLDDKLRQRVFGVAFERNLVRPGSNTMQMFNDLLNVRQTVTGGGVIALFDMPWMPIYMVVIFIFSWHMGALVLAGAVLLAILTLITERVSRPLLDESSKISASANNLAANNLRNAEVIEAMGMIRDIHARWIKRQREFLGLQAEASSAAGGFQAASKMVQQVLGSALLGLSAWLLLHNQLNGGPAMMIVSSIIGGRVLTPLVQMVAQWRGVVNARDAWGRLEMVLAITPEREPGMPLPPPRGLLTVEQLVAGAPVSPGQPAVPILKGVQFALQPGETLAVIGPSAAGKTTLARLLVGLWPAAGGKVRLDGADVFTWNKTELGPHLGYLPQGVELFEGTVAENIARFGELDAAKVRAAADSVGLHAFIEALPQGYDTPVGRDGAVLSGGQRQRVALARALYGEPAFVVLDEPNSSLDEAGDQALAAALRGLKARGATAVVMTHRTSVLGVSDKILLLIDGAQQAFGPRDEVLAAMKQAQDKAAAQAQAQARPSPTPGGLAVVPAAGGLA